MKSYFKENGYVVPGVFAVVAMIATIVGLITNLHHELILMAQDTSHAQMGRFNQLLLPGIQTDAPLCAPLTSDRSRYVLCSLFPRPFKMLPRLGASLTVHDFDLEKVFRRPDICNAPVASKLRINGRLSASPLACEVTKHTASSLVLIESLAIGTLHASPTSNRTAALIASLGDISVTQQLTVGTDTVMFAVGSIHVKRLAGNDTTPRRITFISNSGDIIIEQMTPGVFPLLLGRAVLQLPSTPVRPPYPLLVTKPYRRITGITDMGHFTKSAY